MNITVLEHSALWQPKTLPIQEVVSACLQYFAVKKQRELAVVLADNAQVQRLNCEFRGKDKPTNVLSFPSDEEAEWGDIILAYEVIDAEAAEQGKSFHDHFCHLLVHGMLHLFGYDHIEQDEAEEMEAIEIEILSKLAIANPYETP